MCCAASRRAPTTTCRSRSSCRFSSRESTRCSDGTPGTPLDAEPAPWRLSRRGPDVFRFAGKTVDFDAQELQVGRRKYPLTLMEANLLRYLIQHEGKAVSRKNMLEDVWNLREDTDTRAIDHFIARLRKYIEKQPSRPRHLLTVRSVGYKFIASPK